MTLPTYDLPSRDFAMFTPQGNDAVAAVVATTVEAAAYCPLTHDQAVDLLQSSLHRLSFVHREVRDTEVEEAIVAAINTGFAQAGLTEIDRDHL
jgi:hypothetical protein